MASSPSRGRGSATAAGAVAAEVPVQRASPSHRTREISGAITVTTAPVRSRSIQAAAGGVDRRPTDDGGHYIAARFNGPAEAFNHFAQDANFNRGTYRALENKWAKAKREGKRVVVSITPHYDGSSARPTMILVTYATNEIFQTKAFFNEAGGRLHGKH